MPWENIGSPVYRAQLTMSQYPKLKCSVCDKQYYMWYWICLHLEEKHPREFAAFLPDGSKRKEDLLGLRISR